MTWKDLEDVYEHLKSIGECHTQKEFASIIGQSPENVSKKLGTLNPVQPKTVYRLKDKYSHIFNDEWLMNGDGNMLQAPVVAQEPMKSVEVGDDKDETIKGLRAENMALINTINKLIDELAAMRGEINAIKAHINIQTYHVASGDVNPVALNDELKKYK